MSKRIEGILAGIGKLLDEPEIPKENVNRRFSNSTGRNVEPFYAPNYIDDIRTEQPVFPLSQLEGHGVLFPESDVTAHGATLVGLGNKPLARPVVLNTGVDHIFYDPDSLWKSDESVVKKFMNRAERLKRETGGKDVYLLPFSGFGQSSDFFTGIGRTMMNYNLANAPASTVKQMDNIIRDRVPTWKGSAHRDAEAEWNAIPAGTRMFLTEKIDKELRNQGSLSEGQARVATARQEQLGVDQHGQLRNVGVLDVNAGWRPNKNPDYNASMFGEGAGVLDIPELTAYDLLQDRVTGSGRPLTNRSLQFADTSKVITQKDIQAAEKALEARGVKIKSGLLPTVATLGAAATSLLGSEETDAAIIPKLSQATQRGNTFATAKSASDYLDKKGATGKSIDYGAGFGTNAKQLGILDTFEPFAREGFDPTFTSAADIPEDTYGRLISTNVLNVIPPEARAEAVKNIGSILKPDGTAVIQTRSASAVNELKKSKTAIPQDEPASFLTRDGTYQKGYTRDELQGYVQGLLGDNFLVEKVPAKDIPNGAAVSVKKLRNITLPTAVAATGLLGGQEEAEASGFGGYALKALERTQRKKPTTASGWKNALKGQGVKPKELQLMGFDYEFGFRKPDITKDEVAEFLKNNEYKIRETILTDAPRYTVKGDFGREGFVLHNPDGSVHSRYNTVSEARQKQFELNENILLPEHEEFQLSPNDSENYREILLKDDVNATKHEEITQEIKNLNDFIDAREDQLYDSILDAGGGQSELLKTKLDDPQVLDAMFKIAKLQQDRAELPYPFLTSHFNEQENILSHLRVADRQAVDNSNTLMVEEIQSDMHQRGSKVGYSKQPEINAMRDRRDALQEESDEIVQGKWSIIGWAEKNMPEELDKVYMRSNQNGDVADEAAKKIHAARNKAYLQEFGESPIDRLGNLDRQLNNLRDKLSKAEIAVPDMPFKSGDKSSWYDLAFKRALVDAAEGDYDSISFTTGKTQGERWKGAADIKGVVNFYDNTLKNHINNWAKQYGVKLTPTKLKADNKGYEVRYEDDIGWHIVDDFNIKVDDTVNTEREAYEWIADKTGQEVLTLPITDKMRKELKDKGVSLFSSPLVSGVAGAGVVGAATRSPVADANEARTQGLLQNMASRRDIAERAGAVPDLTAGLLEQTGRDIINFGAGVINPDYGDIAEGGMFPVTEKGQAALTKAGEVFMDKVAPTLVKVGRGLLDDQPMFGGTLREQLGMVRDQYNKLPESVREEVTPRLGYAGLLALTLSPAAKPVKKAIKKRKKTKQE